MPVRLCVRLSCESCPLAFSTGELPGATVRVCGGSKALGAWDPKQSPKLSRQLVETDHADAGQTSIWVGDLDGSAAQPGTEFKYVVLDLANHAYVWEQSIPLRIMPEVDQVVEVHVFDTTLPHVPSRGVHASGTGMPPQPEGSVDLVVKVADTCNLGVAAVAVCGSSPQLGRWSPNKAVRMRHVADSWEASVYSPLGTEFKYVLWLESIPEPQWEANRPNRRLAVPSGPHYFDKLEDFEEPVPNPGSDVASAFARLLQLPESVSSTANTNETDMKDISMNDSVWIPWGSLSCHSPAGNEAGIPRTIFHAFNWSFAEVSWHLPLLRDLGFDAIQISPAQKSVSVANKEWWSRYQPQDFTQIAGLGSVQELKDLCRQASKLRLMVIADVVFNHMLVVASCSEWRQAQADEVQLRALQQRLLEAVASGGLTAEDFQWPWLPMEGPSWDNEDRFEGWGCGEWSELKHCQRVIEVHQRHLRDLLNAGVRGFRFDAVKHMRPGHVAEYCKFLRNHSDGVYIYGEVLSVDAHMHQEYTIPLQMPTTDFRLTVFLRSALAEGPAAAKAGAASAAANAASVEGVLLAGDENFTGIDENDTAEHPEQVEPALAGDSVRFARNHDTVMNPGTFYGLKSSCREALPTWILLLAVHDGTCLVYPDDLLDKHSGPLLRRALHFRGHRVTQATSSRVCLRYCHASEGLRPALLSVSLWGPEGSLVGLCAVNLLDRVKVHTSALPVWPGFSSGTASAQGIFVQDAESPEASLRTPRRLTLNGGLNGGIASLDPPLVLPPHEAAFLTPLAESL